MSVRPQIAAEELLRRRAARRSMIEWSRNCGFEPAAHHKLIIEKLEASARGEIKRLAIFLPPGSAKSTYSSVLFPPWFLAQRPGSSILACSYSAELADDFGRKCRNIVDDNENILGYSLSKDSAAANKWATSTKSVYFCAGVGGRIPGRRADLGLIDDPIGSIEDADSLPKRKALWDWYEWSFLPRLTPGASVVVISTRWHEDDLMGRLLTKEPGKWTVISIPMEAVQNDPLGRQPGERLWPEYFTQEMVDEAKSSPRKWNGAYQNNPSPEEGSYFKKEWLVGYSPEKMPTNLTIYCASDHACSDKEQRQADSNLLVPFGVDAGDNIWILPDIWWEVADTGTTVDKMIEMMRRRKPVAWIADTEHIVKSIGPFLRTKMREERIYTTRLVEMSGKRDKTAKARSIQGRAEMRKVYFPKDSSWWAKAEHELLTFPIGVHDEFPDVLGVIGRYLDKLAPAQPEPEAPKTVEDFTGAWLKAAHRRKQMAIDSVKNGF